MTELAEVALFTDGVASARAFHRDLVDADPVAEWPGGAIFTAGGAKILLHERAATTRDGPPNEDYVALTVDALDECESLRASGVVFLLELRDPDGRLVELAQA